VQLYTVYIYNKELKEPVMTPAHGYFKQLFWSGSGGQIETGGSECTCHL